MERCIVACTDDSGRYQQALDAAIDRAAGEQARLILYDVTAPGPFTSPRPNEWAGEGESEVYARPLEPVHLEKLGRHSLALQVEAARRRGVDAYAWLPDKAGGDALAAYAASQGAQLILVPSDLDDPAFVEPLRASPQVEYV